jgi:hypothetical protein
MRAAAGVSFSAFASGFAGPADAANELPRPISKGAFPGPAATWPNAETAPITEKNKIEKAFFIADALAPLK